MARSTATSTLRTGSSILSQLLARLSRQAWPVIKKGLALANHHRKISAALLAVVLILIAGVIWRADQKLKKVIVKIDQQKTLSFQPNLLKPGSYYALSRQGRMNIELQKNRKDIRVGVTRNNNSLEFALPWKDAQVSHEGNKVVYSSASNNMAARYELMNNGVKEDLIFETIPQTNTFRIPLRNEGLQVQQQGNTLVFYDQNGEYQYHFLPPFMKDQAGNVSYGVRFSLEEADSSSEGASNQPETPRLKASNQLDLLPQVNPQPLAANKTLVITYDLSWLSHQDRTYPVYLDPTIIHDESSEFVGEYNQTGNAERFLEPAVDANTVALWRMNESVNDSCPGSLEACDISGNGNHAGLGAGTEIKPGIIGLSRYFDQTDDHLLAADSASLDISGSITIEAWIKPNSTDTAATYQVVIGKRDASLSESNYGVRLYEDEVEFYYANSGAFHVYRTTGATIPGSAWTHIAVTFDGSSLPKIYKNGELQPGDCNLGSCDVALQTDDNPVGIGRAGAFVGQYFGGQIDEIRLSNIVRSPAEIVAASVSRPKIETFYQELSADIHTVGLWHMDESANDTCSGGEDVCDVSGNGLHGTATGTTIDSGRLGSARNFAGGTDVVTLGNPNALKILGNQTIEMWLYPTSFSVRQNPYDKAYGGEGTITQEPSGVLNYYYGTAGGNTTPYQALTSTTPLQLNTWNHIAVVRDLDRMQLTWYINGKIDATTTASYARAAPSSLNATIGDGYTNNYIGSIDELRISNVARSPEEIQASAQRRPDGIYTSPTLDLELVESFDALSWTAEGLPTGDGEIASSSAGLVAQWNFNETSGTAADNAEGTAALDGTLTNFADTSGQDVAIGSGWTSDNKRWGAGALMFDGTDDSVLVSDDNALDISSELTIEAWIRTNSTAAMQTIVGKRNTNGATVQGNYNFRIDDNDSSELEFYYSYSGAWQIYTTTDANLKLGEWTHVVLTHEASGPKIYKDGRLLNGSCTTGSCNTILTPDANALGIGRPGSNAAQYFSGSIDSVRLYNRVLPHAEILSNYNAGSIQFQTRTSADGSTWEDWSPTTSEASVDAYEDPSLYNTTDAGLVGYWSMDEAANDTCTGGEDVCDLKNSNDATASGTLITSGVFNNARSFDKSGDFLSVPDDNTLDLDNTGTLEAWVKANNNSANTTNFSSWTSLTAPTGYGQYDTVDGVDMTIVGDKIYYAAYLHDNTTEYFYTAYSDLDGSNFSGWTSQTAPDGAGDQETTSVAIDSDGTSLYYAAFTHDGAVESFYTTSSSLDGTTFNTWTSQTPPVNARANDGSSIDMTITNGKMYLAAYLNFTDSVPNYASYFSTAYADLDGSNFSGWTAQASAVSPGYNDAASVGIDTDGQKIYYAAFAHRGTTEYLRTAYSELDGSNFSGWTAQTAPDGAGVSDSSFGDITIVGGRLYLAYYGHTNATQDFSTANMNLDGTDFSGWTIQTAPGITVGDRDTTTAAVTTDGKKIYYLAFGHNTTVSAGLTLATADLPYQPVIFKPGAYELIRNGDGFILDWAGSPKSFAPHHNRRLQEQWNHVAVTHDGTDMKFLFNGKVIRSEPTTVNFATNSSPLYLGGTLNYGLDGLLDEARIYNTAQTQSALRSHFKQASTNPETLQVSTDPVIKVQGDQSLRLTTVQPQIDDTTVMYLNMNETSGDLAGNDVFDLSNNGNDGELEGTTLTEGITGKARAFGSSDYITHPVNNFDPASKTIEFWIKPDWNGNDGVQHGLWQNTDSAATNPANWVALFKYSSNLLYFRVANSSATLQDVTINATNIFKAGEWTHIIASYDASGAEIYVNGSLVASRGALTPPSVNPDTAGRIGFGHANPLGGGSIDEFKIYNKKITAQEAQEAYRMGSDHYLNRTISSTDFSDKTHLPFYVAGDQRGSYLQTTLGESDYANYLPDENTLAFWHLDEQGTAGSFANDSSGNNYHGVYDGTTSDSGQVGKGRMFTGSNDVNMGNISLVDGAENLTVDAWVYPTAQAASTQYRVYTEQVVLYVGQYGSQIAFYMGNGSSWTHSSVTMGALPINTWTHLAWVKDGTTAYVYINGQLSSTMAAPATLGSSTNNNYLSTWDGTNQFWRGGLDEVRISNVARSATEIRQAFESGRRAHSVNIDFAASLDSANLISGSGDTSFTIDATTKGLSQKGSQLFTGEKIIVKENLAGTEYIAQGTVTSVTPASGAVTVSAWDSGSTFPSGGFTANATVFKWQREYWDLSGSSNHDIDATINTTYRFADGNQGRTVWIDDFQSSEGYLNNPLSAAISSTVNRYFQYRTIFTTSDRNVSPALTSTTLDYTVNTQPEVPTLVANYLHDNAQTPDTTPEIRFSTTDVNSDDLIYEIQYYTDSDFSSATSKSSASDAGFSNITTPADTNPFTQGDIISYTFPTLASGTTYFYRVRALDDTFTPAYSDWSEVRSFTVDTTLTKNGWKQTHADQFSTDAASENIVIDNTNHYVTTEMNQIIRPINISSPSNYSNHDVILSIDTSTLISQNKMQSDCDDLRFYSDENMSVSLTFYLESGCNTTTTQVWVRVSSLPAGYSTIYMSYGDSSATSASESWSGNYYAAFESSCPTNWTSVSSLNGSNLFPRGSTSPGGTGGAASHQNSYSITSGQASAGDQYGSGTTQSACGTAHTHLISGNTNFTAIVPPYKDVVYCSHTNNTLPQYLPTTYLGFFENTPSNWTADSQYNSNFPRGNTSAGGTGGAATHNHTYSGTSGNSSSGATNAGWSSSTPKASHPHTHTYSGTTSTDSNLPPYYELIFANPDSTQIIPPAIIGMINTSSVPMGWESYSNINSSNLFLRGAATAGGTGGTTTHTHTMSGTTSGPSAINNQSDSSGTTNSAANHTHTYSGTTGTGSNIPPYLDVQFIQRKPDLTTETYGSEIVASDTITSTKITRADVYDAPWDMFAFSDDESTGTITYQVLYDVAGTPTLVSDSVLPGNSTGFSTSPVDISALTDSAYDELYLRANLSGQGPILYDWEINPNNRPSSPSDLLVEGETNPSVVYDPTPEFSAIYNDIDTQDKARYYQVQVSLTSNFSSDFVWDSGKISTTDISEGTRSPDISYDGTTLQFGKTYYWRIKFWDQDQGESPWDSESASFTFINLNPSTCLLEESIPDNNHITLSWISGSNLSSAVIERNVDGAGFSSLTTVGAGVTSYPDETTSDAHTYQYRVKETYSGLESTWCTTATLTLETGTIMFENVNFD